MSSMVGRRLRQLRGTRTQEEMADLLGIGRAAYGHIESGKNDIDGSKLKILADFHHCSVDYILCLTDERMPGNYEYKKDTQLSDEDKEVLDKFNSLPSDQRDAIIKLIDGIQSPSKN
ncbi:helix-turn-helix domain-containing protein [Brevibacillus brevis]|uniref:helix-turn-helix domain-containing protein n=1 Tax=Brevibacillus brevis TaxID=1393 RepID=UPI001157C80F|nr:helix-turn-helix transcriptional regulator [Lysinibacillus sp. SDF0063]TQR29422.1 XRE family transcriptional regulator [Lysinibacillus sp. SDF0063]